MGDLQREILAEKEIISATLETLQETLSRPEKTVVELAAMATFIQNIYGGMENMLKRILKFNQIAIPDSRSFHRDLLGLSVKNQIISDKLCRELDIYRAFRHFFMHGYGIMLEEKRLLPLAENLPKVWQEFEAEIELNLKNQ